jgi:transposase
VIYFVGLDVSLDETAICAVDDAGTILREGKAATDPEAIAIWLQSIGVPFERIDLEAGPLSPWLHEGLRDAGLSAICIETRRMKGAIAAMAVKTDRPADAGDTLVDAQGLGHGRRQAARDPSCHHRGCAQVGGDHAPDLGGRLRFSVEP